MDFSKFKTSDWLMIGGAAVMLICGMFINWASFGGYSGNNAFDYFFTGGIAWILVVATGVVAFLLAGGMIKRDGLPWPLVLLAAAGLGGLLMLLRLILGGGSVGEDPFEVDLDRAAGMYLSFIGAAAAAAGAFMNFTASGGSMSDLTDMDKIKSQFGGNGGGGSTPPPPPPPPGMTPPPPPPPPAG